MISRPRILRGSSPAAAAALVLCAALSWGCAQVADNMPATPASTAAVPPASAPATTSRPPSTTAPTTAVSPGVVTPRTTVVSSSASTPSTTAGPPAGATPLPAQLPASAPTLRVPILMYHFVDSSPPPAGRWSAGLTVSTAMFERQMDYLVQEGFHPVTLEDIYAAMAGLRPLPSKPVALTFDDGNRDNFTVAYPILCEHGFVATFFVITGFVGNRLSMSWDDLRTMSRGGMAIGSHTFDHKDLRTLDGPALDAELRDSRDAIKAEIGVSPTAVCYPSGRYDDEVVAAVTSAGYLIGVTTTPGTTLKAKSRYIWPRVRVYASDSLEGFISGVASHDR